jgi:hypothetical protein
MIRPSSVLNGTRPRPLGGSNMGEFFEPEDTGDNAQARQIRIAARTHTISGASAAGTGRWGCPTGCGPNVRTTTPGRAQPKRVPTGDLRPWPRPVRA